MVVPLSPHKRSDTLNSSFARNREVENPGLGLCGYVQTSLS